jgi:hypothetical protein
MNQDAKQDFPQKVGYYDYDERTPEMPEMRPRVDTEETRPSESMPELQTTPLGHAVPLVPKTTKGHVYFIETEDGHFIKIGFSKHVQIRMSQLGTLRPASFALRPIGSMPAGPQVERWLHEVFAKHRDNGEWFRSTPEIRNFIASLPLTPFTMNAQRSQAKPKVKCSMSLLDDTQYTEPNRESGKKNPAAVALGRRGGNTRAQKLTAEERTASARKAGLAGGRGRKKEDRAEAQNRENPLGDGKK